MGIERNGPLWVLDDGVLEILLRVLPITAIESLPQGEFALSEQTMLALSRGSHPAHGAVAEVFKTLLIDVGSEEFEYLVGQLRSQTLGDTDLAEHQAIAWAVFSTRPARLVTLDKLALYLAIRELGPGGGCHPFDLWASLYHLGRISLAQHHKLIDATTLKEGYPWIPRRMSSPANHTA